MYPVIKDILEKFRLHTHREDFHAVVRNIDAGVVFKGTNLWILIFAIFIASLGLNVNSNAVIIGAMLVSPLMGPIVGIGLAMAINDVQLLKKASRNFAFAVIASLVTSTLYFILTPLNAAHSEILARTSPTIYDVLIAFVGGLAGIIALASKFKGNVLPGVAIATALMPPLCTAGYGLATFQINYFGGAFYLFLINSVFIALATLIVARFLRFPFRKQPNEESRIKARRIIWMVICMTVLPSIYFAYEIITETRFMQQAKSFVEREAILPGDYLLHKSIDPKQRTISLVFGGNRIEESQRNELRKRMRLYNLEGAKLEIKQGFSVEHAKPEKITLEAQRDANNRLTRQIYSELLAQNFPVASVGLEASLEISDSSEPRDIWLASIKLSEHLNRKRQVDIKKWLKVRLNTENIAISFSP